MTKHVRYRRLAVNSWSDDKFRRLGRDATMVWHYLFTHPNLLPFGCMRARPEALALEVPWLIEPEAFLRGFQQLVEAGEVLVDPDPDALFLALPGFLSHNPPASPNAVKSWRKLVNLVSRCAARSAFFEQVCQLVAERGESFVEHLPEEFLEAREAVSGDAAHA